MGAAHVLLKEAAETLSEEEIRKMEELTNQNRALKEELQRSQNDTFRSYSPAVGGRVTPTRMDEYHRIIEGKGGCLVTLQHDDLIETGYTAQFGLVTLKYPKTRGVWTGEHVAEC